MSRGQKKRFSRPGELERHKRVMGSTKVRRKISRGLKLYWARVRGEIERVMSERGIVPARQFVRGIKGEESLERIAAEQPKVLDELARKEVVEVLEAEIRKLSGLQQRLLRLRFYDNKSLEEVGVVVGMPLAKIKRTINAALSRLAGSRRIQQLR